MSMFLHTQAAYGFHKYKGVIALGALLWLALLLIGCSTSRKEYVVNFTRGNDTTAQGSHERPCQTVKHCQMLADRDGVRSYWMVYQ
jgi:hypothetical protein